MKPHKHAALIHAWADGAIIEYYAKGSNEWGSTGKAPQWDADTEYRTKPEAPKLKLIDWSKMPRGTMTNWGEFYAHDHSPNRVEITMAGGECFGSYYALRLVEQPNFQYWGGGDCPVPEGVVVEVECTDGATYEGDKSSIFCWNRPKSSMLAIRAYRIIRLAEGFTDHESEAV